MAKKHDVHVSKVPGGSRWKVSQDSQVISTHNKQGSAIATAKSEAKRIGSILSFMVAMEKSVRRIATATILCPRSTGSTR